MKIIFLLLSLICLSSSTFSQKMNADEQIGLEDKIETKLVKMKSRAGEGISLQLIKMDGKQFLLLNGYGGGTNNISSEDQITILFDDLSTLKLQSAGTQKINNHISHPTYVHKYLITDEEINLLGKHGIKSIRKTGDGKFVDIDIPKNKRGSFRKTAGEFLKNLRD